MSWRSKRARGQPDAGYSLTEVLVVLAIIALATAAALSAPRAGQNALTLEAYARRLADDLRLARASAVSDNAVSTLFVSLAPPGHRDGEGRFIPAPSASRIELTGARSLLADAEGGARFAFYGDGGASGGAVRIGDAARVYRVEVDWMTGAVRVEQQRNP